MKTLRNFIDGRFAEPASREYLESFNPATGDVHLKVSDSDARDVELAVQAARRAFRSWAATPIAERAQWLHRIADRIEARKHEFAVAESRDQGKPVWLAEAMDIPRAIYNFRFFAGAMLHTEDRAMRTDAGTITYVEHKPVGVAGLISPWNLPLYLLTWKIAPCIAFGNTAVCKPSEFTSHTAEMLAEVFQEVKLPSGVVNLVFGLGGKAGAALVAHPEVPLVSFTGGTATGATIASIAAPMFKKVSLELGGKNPVLIFDDANFAELIDRTVRSSYLNQGEICLCGSRIYVQRGVYEKFLAAFTAKVRELKVGDPSDPATKVGALISREHLEKVESFVRLAREEGADVLVGGKRPELPAPFHHGYFFEPTVLTGVKHTSRVQQEEIFGPVVTVTPFDTEAEVISLANGVKYGLSATVWTESLSRAHRLAEALEAGTIWVNTWMLRDLRAPFGGMKASGVGREGQNESREFFTEAKTICIHHGVENV